MSRIGSRQYARIIRKTSRTVCAITRMDKFPLLGRNFSYPHFTSQCFAHGTRSSRGKGE
jgi:hypothetical protein